MDLIHKKPVFSIYVQTEYLVNSDMSIPFALARSWNFGVQSNLETKIGLPPQDRAPQFSPLVLKTPVIPKGR